MAEHVFYDIGENRSTMRSGDRNNQYPIEKTRRRVWPVDYLVCFSKRTLITQRL